MGVFESSQCSVRRICWWFCEPGHWFHMGNGYHRVMEVASPHVWAGQFRLPDAWFVKMGKDGIQGVKSPASMGLCRDFMSVNTARGTGHREVELEF